MANRFTLPFADVGNGVTPEDGAKLFFFDAGTSNPRNTFSDKAGATPNANPVIANSNGVFSDIFIEGDYKVRLTDKNDVQIWEADSVEAGVLQDAWVSFSGAATRTSNTAFTLTGDQTGVFQVGRRIKIDDSSTLYGTIITAVFTSLTTVTVALDSGSITASSSAVSVGLVSVTNKEVDSKAINHREMGVGATARSLYEKLTDEGISVKDYGATGDGSTDDTAAIQATIDALAFGISSIGGPFTNTGKIIFPTGTYLISSALEFLPGMWVQGAGQIDGQSNTPATVINVSHDGTGFRFVRNRGSNGNLDHFGGIEHCSFNGQGSTTGTNQKIIELGDSADATTQTGAWHGFVRNCTFKNTAGHAIHSSHSQEWIIEDNYFNNVTGAIHYDTVVASSKILGNSFDLGSATKSGSIAIRLAAGLAILGGATGTLIEANYIIKYERGIRLTSIDGASVVNNELEGVTSENLWLTDLDEAGGTDGSGCVGALIEGNSFINAGADGAPIIKLDEVFQSYVGINYSASPNGSCGFFIDIIGNSHSNILLEPRHSGNNSTNVAPDPLPYDHASSVVGDQTWVKRSGIKLATRQTSTPVNEFGTADKGTIFHDGTTNNIAYWDGTSVDKLFRITATATTVGAAGSASALPATPQTYFTIVIDNTEFKIPGYLV